MVRGAAGQFHRLHISTFGCWKRNASIESMNDASDSSAASERRALTCEGAPDHSVAPDPGHLPPLQTHAAFGLRFHRQLLHCLQAHWRSNSHNQCLCKGFGLTMGKSMLQSIAHLWPIRAKVNQSFKCAIKIVMCCNLLYYIIKKVLYYISNII